MMTSNRKRILCLCMTAVLAFSLVACASSTASSSAPATSATPTALGTAPGDPATIPDGLEIDWNYRYTFSELESQLDKLAETYPTITEKYSIGTSWQERDLWCLEITNEATDKAAKTGIGIFANIHGGERESASSAMYTAWWALLNSEDAYVKAMLDKYVLYVIPVINPDGYEQSFVVNTRQNMRPNDKNKDGIPFSDPYNDIDGDGFVATIFKGTADAQPTDPWETPRFGMESSDWDKNGVLGDDAFNSGIDMNRTFDYQWNRYDITTDVDGKDVIGNNSLSGAGPDAASEPEIEAVQNFLAKTPMAALTSLHTGIQCVLYPWCYRPYDASNPKDAEIPFMQETAKKMADKYTETTGRGFYTKSSWEDYPTSSEMIDYSFGRFNIHSYTIEVYDGGKSETGNKADCKWENNLPEEKWVFYAKDEIQEKLGFDPNTLQDKNGMEIENGEGLWFYTSSTAQMVNQAPEEQDIMVKGAKDAILVMIESEPSGTGYQCPAYLK